MAKVQIEGAQNLNKNLTCYEETIQPVLVVSWGHNSLRKNSVPII